MTKPRSPEQMPFVEQGTLFRPDGTPICDLTGRTGFVDWLKRNKSFRYQSLAGVEISVIKEARKGRTGEYFDYWYAHRRVFGELVRVYLGKAEKVTLNALEKAAGSLAQLELGTGVKKGRTVVRLSEDLPGEQNKNVPDGQATEAREESVRQEQLF